MKSESGDRDEMKSGGSAYSNSSEQCQLDESRNMAKAHPGTYRAKAQQCRPCRDKRDHSLLWLRVHKIMQGYCLHVVVVVDTQTSSGLLRQTSGAGKMRGGAGPAQQQSGTGGIVPKSWEWRRGRARAVQCYSLQVYSL
jgi:hypothetical protein